jgi:hypothetical protein
MCGRLAASQNCLGVKRVVLHTGAAFTIWGSELRWNKADIVAHLTQSACPEVGRTARFHCYDATFSIREPLQKLISGDRLPDHHALCSIDAVQLHDVLG